MRVEQKLTDLGLELGKPGTPVANYISAVKTGNLLFVAGHIPFLPDGSILHTGKLGRDISDEQGYEAAKTAMVNCLVSIKDALGDLDRVKRVVKLFVMVNAETDFNRQPFVANGASDLLVELYGDQGRHARSAVGMGSLPLDSCVEIEMIVEVED